MERAVPTQPVPANRRGRRLVRKGAAGAAVRCRGAGSPCSRPAAFFESTWKPALESVMQAGHLNGWAGLRHAHGGPYIWQVIYHHARSAPASVRSTWPGV